MNRASLDRESLDLALWTNTTLKMYVIELPFNKILRLHSATYYRIKKSTTDAFLELQAF